MLARLGRRKEGVKKAERKGYKETKIWMHVTDYYIDNTNLSSSSAIFHNANLHYDFLCFPSSS